MPEDLLRTRWVEFCNRKELDPTMFDNFTLSLPDDLAAHAAWAYKNIYSHPYPKHGSRYDSSRTHHGIQHVVRVAINVIVFANLYRRYDDQRALALTGDELKLNALAGLFHDSGREGDGVDYWDSDSGLFLYFYLRLGLKLPHEKSVQYAEGITNKDTAADKPYYHLGEDLKWTGGSCRARSISQDLIGNSDCLDIIRARPAFEVDYLSFYKLTAKNNKNARKDLIHLISEQRSIIEAQGDSFEHLDFEIKDKYASEGAYKTCEASIIDSSVNPFAAQYKLIPFLYADGQFLPVDQLKQELTCSEEEYPNNLLLNGQVFGRSIWAPNATAKYSSKLLAQTEIEYALQKSGNPFRGISMFGYGCPPCANSGLLLFGQLKNAIYKISATDLDSGWGSKLYRFGSPLPPQQAEQELKTLFETVQIGGKVRKYDKYSLGLGHNEISYLLTHFDAVFYSKHSSVKFDSFHPSAPLIFALLIQQAFFLKTQKMLPLYEYLSKHNRLKAIHQPSETEMIEHWKVMLRAHLKKMHDVEDYVNLSIDNLKIYCVYAHAWGSYEVPQQLGELAGNLAPADSLFPQAFRKKLSTELEGVRQEHLSEVRGELQHAITKSISHLRILTLHSFPEIYQSPLYRQQINHIIDIYLRRNPFADFAIELEIYFSRAGIKNSLAMPLLALLKSIYKPTFLSNKVLQVYLLAKTCELPDKIAKIQKYATNYLHQLISNKEHYTFFQCFLLAQLFDVYLPLREELVHLFRYQGGRDHSQDAWDLIMAHSLENLSLREAHHLNHLLSIFDADKTIKTKVLGSWYKSEELKNYSHYQKHPETNKLFTAKTNYQLHCWMKSNDLLSRESVRKHSFFKAKTLNREEYQSIAAQYIPLKK